MSLFPTGSGYLCPPPATCLRRESKCDRAGGQEGAALVSETDVAGIADGMAFHAG